MSGDPFAARRYQRVFLPLRARRPPGLTLLDYEGGLLDTTDREFRGFRLVTSSDAVGNSTETTFSQEFETKGKKEKKELFAGTQVIKRETFSWIVPTQPSLGRTIVYLGEHKSEELSVNLGPNYDPVSDKCLLNRNEPPDDYGRVTKMCSLSCTLAPVFSEQNTCASPTAGQVNTTTSWANPQSGFVRERPSHLQTQYKNSTGSLETLAENWFDYDGLTNGFTTKGNLTRTESLLDQSFAGPADNPVTSITYDAFGNITSATDPLNCTTTSDFNSSPWKIYPSFEENCLGHRVTKVMELRVGEARSITNRNNQVTELRYDDLGREIRMANPLDNINGCQGGVFTCTAEKEYSLGNPNSSTFEGKLTAVVTRSREPNGDGAPMSHSTSDFRETVQFIDALGRPRAQTVERVIGADANDPTPIVYEHIEYDEVGNPIATYVPYQLFGTLPESPAQATTNASFVLNGNISSVLDPLGRPYQVTPPDGHPITNWYQGTNSWAWDPVGSAVGTDGVHLVEDDFGREISRFLIDGNVTELYFQYVYDGLDRLLTTTVSGNANTVVVNDYDTLGRVIKVTDNNMGNSTTPGIVKLGYDKIGNGVYRDTPKANERVQWCYDELGRPKARFLFSDTDVYDATVCNNLTGAESTYEYDNPLAGVCSIGQLYKANDGTGEESFEYDARCRPTRQTKMIASKTAEMQFEYDLADHVTKMTYPDGEVVFYSFNKAGSVKGAVGDSTYLSSMQYDFLGRPDWLVHGNGAVDNPIYWGAIDNFRLKKLNTTGASTTHRVVLYDYNDIGKIGSITDQLYGSGQELTNNHVYSYDGLQRLVGDDWLGPHTSYDESFEFDPLGNLEIKGIARSFDSVRTNQIAMAGPETFAYDENGRLEYAITTAAVDQKTYFYDAIDRLTQIEVLLGGQATITHFEQDYADRRVSSHNGAGANRVRHFFQYAVAQDGELTKYYFAGDLMIAGRVVAAPLLSDTPVAYRGIEAPPWLGWGAVLLIVMMILGPMLGRKRWSVVLVPVRAAGITVVFAMALLPPGLAKADLAGGVDRWHYHLDHLGSPQLITDETGAVYRHNRYQAYGEVRHYGSSGSPVTVQDELRHGFTGYESEGATGLLYAGARFLVPELGLFLTHDPVGQFASPYAYSPGDPINGSDPDGEIFFTLVVGVIVALQVRSTIRAIEQGASVGEILKGQAEQFAIQIALTLITGPVASAVAGATVSIVATRIAAIGYGAYNVGAAARRGDFVGAVVSALGLIEAAALANQSGRTGRSCAENVGNRPKSGDSGRRELTIEIERRPPQVRTEIAPVTLSANAAADFDLIGIVLDGVSIGLVALDLVLAGPTGEGIAPAMAIQAFKLGTRESAKAAAKKAFIKEAGNLPRRVLRDRTTKRIKGVGAGKATFRPKLDGRFSVTPQSGKARDVLHFGP